jgi:hypothetical protein
MFSGRNDAVRVDRASLAASPSSAIGSASPSEHIWLGIRLYLPLMPSDPRLSFCFGCELRYGGRIRVRNNDLNAERSIFRNGYDAIARLCMGMCYCHPHNMVWRRLIGNPARAESDFSLPIAVS